MNIFKIHKENDMIENQQIYAAIYIRSIIDLDDEKSYYKKALVTNLAMVELDFAKDNRKEYDLIVKRTLKVWKIVQKGKAHFMIQSVPLISSLYSQSKKQFDLPKILFTRLADAYYAAGDDKYEVRSFDLAKEIFQTTREVIADDDSS